MALLSALVILAGCGGDNSGIDQRQLTALVNLFAGTDAAVRPGTDRAPICTDLDLPQYVV